mgnify:CR=1 FL=1
MLAWWRRLPPNVQGALWLVSGGFIFTSTGVMIRLLSEQIDSVQTAFFRAVIGLVLLIAGIAWPWLSRLPFGRLPGDFSVERENFSFFFPLATSIVVSIVISLLIWLFRK